ncbi:MAG: chloride channel protein [Balneolales bacterium]
MKKNRATIQLLIWFRKKISGHQLILLLSILAGIISGIAAFIIKNAVHFIKEFLTGTLAGLNQNYLLAILPSIGILATIVFIHLILRRRVGHGIPMTLFAISKNKGRLQPHNMYSSIVSSALTVGFGGSAGLEGPTVATGAAWGSNLGKFFGVSYRQMILLLACSSAGAMASIFKAPVAGIVFVLEVIMIDLTMSSIIPLLLASLSGALVSFLFLGMDVLVPAEIQSDFVISEVPWFLLFGVFTGMVSVYFTRMFKKVGQLFDFVENRYSKWFIGSICLGMIIFFFPAIYGEGYEIINSALRGEFSYLFEGQLLSRFDGNFYIALTLLAILILLKVVATSITFGSGGVGGIFAPTLFMGANSGLLFALTFNQFDLFSLPLDHFALAGMGGLIAGVLHAPLTGMFLIAEITGGYALIFPLMITATISYAISKKMEKNSVYTYQLRKRGELFTHDKDQVVLSLMDVRSLIETDFSVIHENAMLGDLIEVIINSKRDLFPVLDDDKNLKGVVNLNDVRNLMFDVDMYDRVSVRELMHPPSVHVSMDEPMRQVARTFQVTRFYTLPVLENGKYKGFVSRANVFSAYRKFLQMMTEE